MKTALIVLAALIPFFAKAQYQESPKKGIQELSTGILLSAVGTETFKKNVPFDATGSFVASINLIRKNTHHHLFIGPKDTSLTTLNGYLLPRNWDVYCLYSRKLGTGDQYLSVGIEKVLPISKNGEAVLFYEIGNSLTGTWSASFGLIGHMYHILYSRERIAERRAQRNGKG